MDWTPDPDIDAVYARIPRELEDALGTAER